MLLSRTAESLYWAARYLERAEDTARVVREHTNLIVDLPVSVPVTWAALLAITGSRESFDEAYDTADESSIATFLVADRENSASLVASVEAARENLRTTREVLPREVWQAINDLHLYVMADYASGVARSSRTAFLERIIGDVQRIGGVLGSSMSRDEAYEFLRLGRNLERADMTTRVLDVQAGTLLEGASAASEHDGVRWMSVLRSIAGLQMYHRTTRRPVEGAEVVNFLTHDRAFPRSVAHCLAEVADGIERLPRAELVRPACATAIGVVAHVVSSSDGPSLREAMDRVQIAIADVHSAIGATYFLREQR